MNKWQNLTDLSGRLLIAAIFLISGIGKVTGYAATQGYMEAMSTEARS
jgi:putative oxidoreductase